MMDDMRAKLKALRGIYKSEGANALLITEQHNLAWLLNGARTHIGLFAVKGICNVLICEDEVYLIGDNIDTKRLMTEEIHSAIVIAKQYPWHDSLSRQKLLLELTGGKWVTDTELEGSIQPLRMRLSEIELETYRELGRRTGQVMEEVCFSVEPGMSEFEVAAMMMYKSMGNELEPNVVLVGADERAYSYRHPLPTDRRIQEYVMLVLVTRFRGLMAAITRFVSFRPIDDRFEARRDAIVNVNTTAIANTRPGVKANEVLRKIATEYDRQGYANEWRLHHQGGPIGYRTREYKVTPDLEFEIQCGQAYAWNPSVQGFKAEDTILVHADGNEQITLTPNLPAITKVENGISVMTADVLVRNNG